MKKKIKLLSNPEPKFLFVNDNKTWATIATLSSIVNGGTPIVPDGFDDEGDDASFEGQVDNDMPEGDVNLKLFELP